MTFILFMLGYAALATVKVVFLTNEEDQHDTIKGFMVVGMLLVMMWIYFYFSK